MIAAILQLIPIIGPLILDWLEKRQASEQNKRDAAAFLASQTANHKSQVEVWDDYARQVKEMDEARKLKYPDGQHKP